MEIWQTIIQLILLPTSIVAVLAFVMREFFKKYLSKDIEKYKGELQSNLESHRAKLKAEYDLRHFEFQTRFSLYHQQKGQAIQEIYSGLSEVEYLLQIATSLSKPPPQNENEQKQEDEFNVKLNNRCEDFHLSICKNSIFLDEETANLLQNVNGKIREAKFTHLRATYGEDLSGKDKEKRRWKATDIVSGEISKVRKLLEHQFRQLLSAENPNNQLEKNNDRTNYRKLQNGYDRSVSQL